MAFGDLLKKVANKGLEFVGDAVEKGKQIAEEQGIIQKQKTPEELEAERLAAEKREKAEKEKVTVQINGGGAIGTMMADANCKGQVRGFVGDPHQYLVYNDTNKLAVGLIVGTNGYLKVIKDMGLKDQFAGQVALQSGEIGDDVASYLMNSEQTPSVVSVGVLVNPDYSVAAAGGIIIQAMPGADDAVLDDLEMRLQSARAVSGLINEGADIRGIIQNYLPGVEVQFLEEKDIQWQCNCSYEKISGLLKSIGVDELTDMIEKDGETEVVCHFCSSHYHFDREQLEAVLAEMKQDLLNQ